MNGATFLVRLVNGKEFTLRGIALEWWPRKWNLIAQVDLP